MSIKQNSTILFGIARALVLLLLCGGLILQPTDEPVAAQTAAPGGVDTNLQYWVRADGQVVDNGTQVTSWIDETGNQGDFDFTAGTPKLEENIFNYNPAVDFTPNEYLRYTSKRFILSATEGEIFYVLQNTDNPTTSTGYPGQFAGTASNGHYDHSTRNVYDTFGSSTRYNWDTQNPSAGGPVRNAQDPHIYNVHSATNDWQAKFDGIVQFTSNSNTTNFSTQDGAHSYIGYNHNTYFNGSIAEILLFDRKLTTAERDQVNSALAIKYGITLGDNGVPATYVDSGGATIWNNATYHNDVAGIGRDDSSALYQKQSRSVRDDTVLSIAIGTHANTNQAASGTFASDKQFLLWGNDGGAPLLTEAYASGIPADMRMNRVWQVANTNGVSGIEVCVLSNRGTEHRSHLLVNASDNSFAGGNTETALAPKTINAQTYMCAAGVTLNDGDYLTFAGIVTAPGGVGTNLQYWVRADGQIVDNGTQVTSWIDETGLQGDFDFTAGTPKFEENILNYNPAVDFTPNEYLRYTSKRFILSATEGEIFYVLQNTDTPTANTGFPGQFAGTSPNGYYDHSNRNVYDTFGSSTLYNWDTQNPPAGGPVRNVQDPHIYNVHSATNDWQAKFDGIVQFTTNSNTTNFSTQDGSHSYIGYNHNTYFNGSIAEILLFDRKLTAAERDQVNSALALKYGITLGDNGVPFTYVDSSGATIWDNATYHNDVAGIGRDDSGSLYQRQSGSVHPESLLSIGLANMADTNQTNTGIFNSDKQFLIWGHQDGVAGMTQAHDGSTFDRRFDRAWQVKNTNSTGAVEVCVRSNTGLESRTHLLVNNSDPGFAPGTTTEHALSAKIISGQDNMCVSGVTLANDSYFTFGGLVTAPGGVAVDLEFWLKADGQIVDPSTTVSNWTDETGTHGSFTAITGDPDLQENIFNFNPAVNFDGGDYLTYGTQMMIPTATDGEIFYVLRNNGASNTQDGFPGQFGGSGTLTVQYDHSNGEVIDTFGTTVKKRWQAFTAPTSGPPRDVRNPHVYNVYSAPNDWAAHFDGLLAHSESSNTVNFASAQSPAIHVGAASSAVFKGDIAEILLYSRKLSSTERHQVNSALAIKYGITLGANGTPITYTNSSGTVIWDNAAYHNDVAVIGRDDSSALEQRQSRSVNDSAVLTIGHGGIVSSTALNGFVTAMAQNTLPFSSNNQFLVWGHDGADTTGTGSGLTTQVTNAGINAWMMRKWVAQETGSMDATLLQVPVSAASVGLDPNEPLYFITADDGGFTTNVMTGTMTLNGSNFEISHNFDGVTYFTFGQNLPDTDGDNIVDLNDADDDNDGILDTAEVELCQITNGDFTNDADGWTITGTPTSYTFGTDYVTPASGRFIDFIADGPWNTSFAQTLTGLTPGVPFDVSMHVGALSAANNLNLTVHFNDQLEQTFPGTVLAVNGGRVWNVVAFQITPTSATGEFKFTADHNGGGNNDLYVDNVVITIPSCDTDSDGLANRLDLDTDGDGIPDNIEAQTTAGYIAPSGTVSTTGTYAGLYNNYGTGFVPVDTDGDRLPDFVDLDSNDLGSTDTVDAGLTLDTTDDDQDGLVNAIDSDDVNRGPVNAGITDVLASYPQIGNDVGWRFLPSPGGVAADLRLWLKADAGVTGATTVSDWLNQSPLRGSVSKSTPTNQPTIVPDSANFNPGLAYDTSIELVRTAADGGSSIWFAETDPLMYLYVMAPQPATSASGAIFEFSGNDPTHQFSGGRPSMAGTGSSLTHSSALEQGVPSIVSSYWSNSNAPSALHSMAINGGNTESNTSNNIATINVTGNLGIGGNGSGGDNLRGTLYELIMYNADQTAEFRRIESYLAIKYGITLDQATPTDYLASDETVVWDAATVSVLSFTAPASGYNNNIAGIAYDFASGLDQPKSMSANPDGIVTMDHGVTLGADASFLMWGNNNLDASAWLSDTIASGYPEGRTRLTREWYVQETGTVGPVSVSIQVDDPDLDLPQVQGALYLLVDSNRNGDFSDEASVRMAAQGGGVYSANFDFEDGQRFTFATANSGLRGVVFQDDDTDGRQDATEEGIEGVIVTAVDANGVITTTTTDLAGNYAFIGGGGLEGSTRVTFTLPITLQTSMQPTIFGPDHRTTVQFVYMGGNGWTVATAGFTFQNRTSSCENPTIASSCYTTAPSTTDPGVFSFNWIDGPDVNNIDAASQEVGSVWGNALNSRTGRLYSAAMLKRHIALGPLAPRNGNDVTVDGVYIIDYSTSGGTFNPAAPGFTLQDVTPANGSPSIDLGTVQRIPDTNGELDNDYELLPDQSIDLDAFAKVGTIGFGDADLAPDGSIWLVNLNQRTLIRVDTNGLPSDGSAAPAGNVTTTPIADPGCADGDFRPWALTFYNGKGYLGVVCSAETSQNRADLHAYIRSFDPTNPGAGFATELDFPLDYDREDIYRYYGGAPGVKGDWLPWSNTWNPLRGFLGADGYPQPILSDIEFTVDGNMSLGFMDRFGHQTYQTNLEALPLIDEPQERAYITAGDLTYVCTDGAGGWILEGSVGCEAVDNGGILRATGGGLTSALEYFHLEEAGLCIDHLFFAEIYGGSHCIGPNGRDVLSAVYGPGGEFTSISGNPRFQGFRTFDSATGSNQEWLTAFLPQTFACADGTTHNMGELTCFCPPPSVEIGSRVWQDSNVNGIQDPGEPGIEGVTVELVSGGTVIATATTDARGEYFFSSDSGTSTANTIYNLSIPGAGVSVRIPNAEGGSQQVPLSGHAVTPADQGSDDTVDSDTNLNGNDAVIPVNTTGGRIDHSYDFGFAPDIWDVALRKSAPVQYAQAGSTIVFSIEVFNQSFGPVDNIDLIDYVPANLTVNDANWTPASLAGPGTVTRMLNSGDELPATGLLPGESVVVDITMNIAGGLADNTVIVNKAEISAFTTFGGGTVTDVDSTPDATDNETNVKDGVIDEDGLNNPGDDEDDHDIEQITITSQNDIYDLALVKRLATNQPSVVSVGDDVRFTIEVFNQGTSPASNIEVVDRYPAGFTLSPNDGSWTDVGGTSATRALGVTLQPGQSTTVGIILRAGNATGTAMNYAEIQSDDGDDVDSQPEGDEGDNNGDPLIDDVISDNGTLDEDDHDVAAVTVQNFDLALRKTLAVGQPTTTVRGADVTYMIEVFNQGSVDAFDITIIDYLTDTLTLSENDGNGWTQVESNQVVKNIPGPIAPNGSEQIMITLRVSDTAALGTLDNLAEILSASASPGGPPAEDSDSTPDDGRGNDPLVDDQINDDGTTDEDDHDIATVTVGRFDLALIKEYVSDTSRDGLSTDGRIGINDQVVFRMTVTNQGDVPAYDIRVTDHNPEGIVADDSDPAFNIDNGWITENMLLNHNVLPGPLNPGQSTTIDIVLRSVPPTSILYPAGGLLGTHTNWAEISSASNLPGGPPVVDDDSTPDEDPANDAGGTPGSLADNAIGGDGSGSVPGTDAGTDEDDHDPAQVTVQNTFDLALFKYVVDDDGNPIAGIPEVQAGDMITYGYYVENQGTETATSITLIEHVPAGLILTDNNWTPSNVTGPGTATRTYSNALAPGDFFTDTVIFQAAPTITPGQVYTNIMEIQSAVNGAGLTDIDSDPDVDATNEIFVLDNQIRDNFRLNPAIFDEDDHDPAAVQTAAFEQVTITKTLATSGVIQAGQSLSFTIRIENTGSAPIDLLPLTDTYDTNYLAYDTILGATPAPNAPAGNTGQLNWSDVTGSGTLNFGDVLTVTVNFFAVAETRSLADDTNCVNSVAGQTVNSATVDASKAMTPTSCVGVTIEPPEGKSTIGDWIWHDINNDGIKDNNEPGINGVRVNLYEDGANGGTLDGQIEAAEFVTFTITADDVNGLGDDTGGTNGVGFYQFEVPAEAGDVYIVEVDASNFDPGGPLVGFVYSGDQGGQQYSGTQPRVVPVATAPLAPPENQNVDFGFYCRFDLALDKRLTSADNIMPGDNVTFTMTVYNQGVVTATDVVVADYIPAGFTLNDPNWNGGTSGPDGVSGTVTRTLATTLTPSGTANSMATVDIMLTAGATLSGTFTNTAEIADYTSVVTDTLGNNLPDADSDPDTNDTEDPVKDDVIDEDGKNNPGVDDEDDHDLATVTVVPFTPSLAVNKELNTTPADPTFSVGEMISFTIRITNTGDVTITVLPLEDRYSNIFIEFRNASVVPDPGSGNGVLNWSDLTTVLGDVGPGDSVSLTVSFETMADTTLLQPVAPCTSGGHTPNIVDIDGAFADPDGDDGTGDDIAVVKDGDDDDCAEVEILNPTAVQLAERAVSQTVDGVLIEWTSVTEIDVAGFRIYRVNGTETLEIELRELNAADTSLSFIPAKNSGQSQGASYSMLHEKATLNNGDVYVLEIVKLDSSVQRTVIDVVRGGNIFLPFLAR